MKAYNHVVSAGTLCGGCDVLRVCVTLLPRLAVVVQSAAETFCSAGGAITRHYGCQVRY